MEVRPFINGVLKHTFFLRSMPYGTITLPDKPAYPDGKVPIYNKKNEDLNKMLHYIPDAFKSFYQNILCLPTFERKK